MRRELESKIKRDLTGYLEARDWLVDPTHGNLYQVAFPDLYVTHRKWESRWIDCKRPGQYSFTKAQRIKWPIWESFGRGIWILTAATQEQYDKLFGPPNWRDYWRESWGELPDVDALLAELHASYDKP